MARRVGQAAPSASVAAFHQVTGMSPAAHSSGAAGPAYVVTGSETISRASEYPDVEVVHDRDQRIA